MKEFYLEVSLKKDFSVITETLQRIGIINRTKKEVFQTCHLFHNNGHYFLVHFKELFSMFSFKDSGKIEEDKIHMTDEDFERRNSIIFLLTKWGLIDALDNEYINDNKGNINVSVLGYKEKEDYILTSKFNLSGNKE